jgi:hypothetical protein
VPIRHPGRRTRKPLVRVGLILVALSLAWLVVPAVASPKGAGRTVAHVGKATYVVKTGAPLRTPGKATSSVVAVHRVGKTADIADAVATSAAHGLTVVLLMAAALAIAALYPGLRSRRHRTAMPMKHSATFGR